MSADEAALVLRPDEAGLDPRLAFVLKEATYKAWCGLGAGSSTSTTFGCTSTVTASKPSW